MQSKQRSKQDSQTVPTPRSHPTLALSPALVRSPGPTPNDNNYPSTEPSRHIHHRIYSLESALRAQRVAILHRNRPIARRTLLRTLPPLSRVFTTRDRAKTSGERVNTRTLHPRPSQYPKSTSTTEAATIRNRYSTPRYPTSLVRPRPKT